jgi:hypothetical protein
MRLHRRRQPEPVVIAESVQHGLTTAEVVAPVTPPKRKRRRTRAEVANDRIESEQLAAAEREKELAQIRQVARQEWEHGRRHLPPEPAFDYSRHLV